jgi:hypothetical protein
LRRETSIDGVIGLERVPVAPVFVEGGACGREMSEHADLETARPGLLSRDDDTDREHEPLERGREGPGAGKDQEGPAVAAHGRAVPCAGWDSCITSRLRERCGGARARAPCPPWRMPGRGLPRGGSEMQAGSRAGIASRTSIAVPSSRTTSD